MKKSITNIILIMVFSLISSWCYSKDHDFIITKATYYHAKSGSVTASGYIVDEEKVKSKEHRWIAISRDILKENILSFGDTILIESAKCPGLNGKWIVLDKMGPKHEMRVDFLLHPEEIDELKFLIPHEVKIIYKIEEKTL